MALLLMVLYSYFSGASRFFTKESIRCEMAVAILVDSKLLIVGLTGNDRVGLQLQSMLSVLHNKNTLW